MKKQSGTIYPTNHKNTWVVITKGEKKAVVVKGNTQDIAAKRFFNSRNMHMVKAKPKK